MTAAANPAVQPAHNPRNAAIQGALWLGLFGIALAMLGGSSRPDPIQHAALRPIAALLLIPALYRLRAADLAGARAILGLGGLMLGWMVVQLIPLPPAIWQSLPGRTVIAELGTLSGLQGIWRPISLAPFRGLNALFGTVIPITALLLAMSARLDVRNVLVAIAGLGIINAVIGIVQVIGGPASPFYLFAITNRGAPAGIFANENHAAVFAAIVLLVIARLAVDGRSLGLPRWFRLSLGPAYLLSLLAVLLSGSRAGLAAALLAMVAGGLMVARQGLWDASAKTVLRQRRRGLAMVAASAAGAVIVAAALLLRDRAPAAQDLLASTAIADLRWSLWPVLAAMMRDHWALGTGFGSFDAVYRLYEPSALLLPAYINQAHNDGAQLVIEGGLPAVLAALGLFGWLLTALAGLARRAPKLPALVIFWAAWLAITTAASAVDYPLRTPIFQAVSVWLLLCFARDCRAARGATREPQ